MSYGGADCGESVGNGVPWDEEEREAMNRPNRPTMSHEEWKHKRKQGIPNREMKLSDVQSDPPWIHKTEIPAEDTILYCSPPLKPVAPGYNVPQEGFVVKDSGKRAQFSSGMVRDTTEGKPDVELIFNGPMADRWATHLTKGAMKYPDPAPGQPNWMLADGMEERVRFRKSAVRHFRQWLRGDVDEDHAAAVYFNINGHEYVKAKMEGK